MPRQSSEPRKRAKNRPALTPEQNEINFDEKWYLLTYPDVAKAVRAGEFDSGLEHYTSYGRDEGRKPHAEFDAAWDAQPYPTVIGEIGLNGPAPAARPSDNLSPTQQISGEAVIDAYRKYLKLHANDFAVWVELGNYLMDVGALSEALDAYNRAVALNGDDAQILRRKGDLLRLIGHRRAAIRSYQNSLLQSYKHEPLAGLLALVLGDDATPPAGEIDSRAQAFTFYLDVADLIEYTRHNLAWSGIQRVVSNLIVAAREATAGKPVRLVPVVIDEDLLQVFEISTPLLDILIAGVESGTADRRRIDQLIAVIMQSRRRAELLSGEILIIAGAFWLYKNYDLIATLCSRGISFGLFVHDLIQIKSPEYVDESTNVVFRERLIDALTIANFVLTNSDYVAREVRDFMSSRLNFSIPVEAIPLATEFRVPEGARTDLSAEIVQLCREEYVLYVSTIEVRKNHSYLVEIWNRLLREFGAPVPKLVFIGKWGWKIDDFHDELIDSDFLQNWVVVLDNVGDFELDYLYRHCLFTVYVSFAEGWGLPIGEGLAHGKPCVASGLTSIPEVGGSLVRYVDPHDVREGYRVIAHLLSHRSELEEWTRNVREQFQPKTWASFCAELLDTVRVLGPQENRAPNNCTLPSDEIILGASDDIIRLDRAGRKLVTFRMARAGGWHPVEGWGVWASHRRARLRFRTDLRENDEIKLYLLLKVPPGGSQPRCLIIVGGVETAIGELRENNMLVQVDGKVSPSGIAEIELVSQGRFGRPDARHLYVGLMGLAYCKSSDVLARVSLLEKITVWHSQRG